MQSMDIRPGTLLSTINSPDDLKKLKREQLHQVCDELRQYIIDVVSVHGGHFGASLGVAVGFALGGVETRASPTFELLSCPANAGHPVPAEFSGDYWIARRSLSSGRAKRGPVGGR